MGNREKRLAAARQCLLDKGYARTTARDIVAVSGTSLAAIGYHFRSTEALMNAALAEATEEWGDRLAETPAAGSGRYGDAAAGRRAARAVRCGADRGDHRTGSAAGG